MSQFRWALSGFVFLAFFLFGCDREQSRDRDPDQEAAVEAIVDEPQDPKWSEYISQHTRGVISKKSSIRVRFVNDMFPESQIGKDASKILRFSPEIDADIRFNGRREILVKPGRTLEPGERYEVAVLGKNLKGIPAQLDEYSFSFKVKPQDFEVIILGLQSTATAVTLTGSVVTSDFEESQQIEKMLEFDLGGEELEAQWYHSDDGTSHEFTVRDIERGPATAILTVAWDGYVIGVDSMGKNKLEVRGLGEFKVAKVNGVKGDRQYIKVRFTEKLDPEQNLKGLIQLSPGDFSIRVEDDLVKVYPADKALGKYVVTLEAGIKSELGAALKERSEHEVFFEMQPPKVKFVGKGVILPENKVLSIPFEAINVNSVQVTAFKIYEDNIGQFLQTNQVSSASELGRVGRYLWRKTIQLENIESNKTTRFSLDASELLNADPGSLFRLTLSINRGNAIVACPSADEAVPIAKEAPYKNNEDLHVVESSSWDYAENHYNRRNSKWQDRNNPCKDYYYSYSSDTKSSRNLIASNIGMIAKQGSEGTLNIIATNLQTAEPMQGVDIKVRNFQDRLIGQGRTDSSGFVDINTDGKPFYLVATKAKQIGYLKINAATALPVSHFDVGGEKTKQGIKGHIYGERGVWRPGDNIYLTFVLEDKNNAIPANHPVTMQLFDPKGQLVKTITNNKPVGDFYAFNLKTGGDAITGNWTAKAILGGAVFSKTLKIETVMPNRLKVELTFEDDELYQSDMPLAGRLFGQWLHGATAGDLKADVSVRLTPRPTKFTRSADFVFDDPARSFKSKPQTLFEGQLDETGNADFSESFWVNNDAPGMLTANFTSRVFEEGGAFSTSQSKAVFHPYDNYVGIKLPKGDAARGMLLTDIKHPVEIASLNAKGEPVSLSRVKVSIYKVSWKWWWDKSGDSLARYVGRSQRGLVHEGTVATTDGKGLWEFEIKYPAWGRYLIRACDLEGKHCAGKIAYIDWPGWAGRAQESGGVGASALTLQSDKQEYTVGETALITLPPATQGRALVSVENGSKVLQQHWFEFTEQKSQFSLPIDNTMSPNVYVNVSLIQPHKNRDNDRPIRLYGVVPIKVSDPETKLQPKLVAADEWLPASDVEIAVSESNGRAMTYTVAVVDEGLLGLTSYKTPLLHKHFYKKEALGVLTWDLFDHVVGAYGGELERLLALGGGDELDEPEAGQEEKRFPPVVRFLGPFQLQAKETQKHSIDIPQYLGAVRVMVVAGEQGAYGSTDKSVFVRGDVSLLATLPRVIGPEEELTAPVAVFAMKEGISEVQLTAQTNDYFENLGAASQTITFDKVGDKLGFFAFKTKPELGKGHVKFIASAGEYKAEQDIYIDVRSSNPNTLRQTNITLEPKDTWDGNITPHGLRGTNKVTLEVSSIPPFNLERRLHYLVRYPHGCVEQTTSSAFPQLYLSSLMRLNPSNMERVQNNINAAIERLRGFQTGSGAFSYWPGGWNTRINEWATTYAGHFLVEASKLGYHVPADMLDNWIDFQTSKAQSWITGSGRSQMNQAYRLYALALAEKPELAAMNRLREYADLSSVEKWQLAAAYRLAGLSNAAKDLVRRDKMLVNEYRASGITFGSPLRDRAIILNGLTLLDENKKAKKLADIISKSLYADRWHSTQSIAYSLMALSKYAGGDYSENSLLFTYALDKDKPVEVEMDKPVFSKELLGFLDAGQEVKLKNFSKRNLYVSVLTEGTPKSGGEEADSNGLRIAVRYTDVSGVPIDISELQQGQDFIAKISVRNLNDWALSNIALTHIVASGWEIHNSRFAGEQSESDEIDYQDIRDDRVLTYFGLKSQEKKEFSVLLNAAYLGTYYLPSVSVEAMYDASNFARTKGEWVSVVNQR